MTFVLLLNLKLTEFYMTSFEDWQQREVSTYLKKGKDVFSHEKLCYVVDF